MDLVDKTTALHRARIPPPDSGFRADSGVSVAMGARQLVVAVETTQALQASWPLLLTEYVERIIRFSKPASSLSEFMCRFFHHRKSLT